jgi:hypothetical protein
MEHVQMKRPWKKSSKAWKKELHQRLSPEARAKIVAMATELDESYQQYQPKWKRKFARQHRRFMDLAKACM